MFVAFWLAVTTIVYTLAGFPLIVLLRARLVARPHVEAEVTPSLTVVVAAHNEEADLPAKLANVLSVD